MVVADNKISAFDALTDSELQILRMLAAGHTIKSIAASIDRSEASVNERLRDARRKCGVGSSRELARMLDAQKIWDRKSDLSAPHEPPHDPDQPSPVEVRLTRGMIVMLITISAAAMALALSSANAPSETVAPKTALAATSKAMPHEGRWSLDVMGIPAAERPQRVIIDFHRESNQTWTTRVEVVGADGTSMQSESTAATDGVPVPVTGTMPFIDSVSLRQPDANTLVMSLAKNGAPVSTRVYTISADRTTMTETIVWPGPAVPGLETTIFHRVDA